MIEKASELKECFMKIGNFKKKIKIIIWGVKIGERFIYFSMTIFEYLPLPLRS